MLWDGMSRRRVYLFPNLFRVLLNFQECFYNSIKNTENMFSISFRKQRDEKKENNLSPLIIKM